MLASLRNIPPAQSPADMLTAVKGTGRLHSFPGNRYIASPCPNDRHTPAPVSGTERASHFALFQHLADIRRMESEVQLCNTPPPLNSPMRRPRAWSKTVGGMNSRMRVKMVAASRSLRTSLAVLGILTTVVGGVLERTIRSGCPLPDVHG